MGEKAKIGLFNFFELNTPSDRVFYGLPENHNIIEIRAPEESYCHLKRADQACACKMPRADVASLTKY